MASLISVRLYNTNGTPKTGTTPLMSVIRQSDKTLVVDKESMTEIMEGFYEYSFVGYDKAQLYYFFIDGEQYDGINQLDSYDNKYTRGRSVGVTIDTKKLANDIRGIKEGDVKEGTIGEHIFTLKTISILDFEKSLSTIQKRIDKSVDDIVLNTKNIVLGIKLPKELNTDSILSNIKSMLNESATKNIDELKTGLEYIYKLFLENIKEIKELEEKIESIPQYDDNSVRDEISILDKQINLVRDKISQLDRYDIIKIEKNNGDDVKASVNEGVETIKEEMKEINRKMIILFTRLNSK